MRTSFDEERLKDVGILESSRAIRRCVHCGLCTATCPTYLLLRDERDSPRGRIYMMKAMLEEGRAPTEEEMVHVDRCLSCLSCMTTCPSGVNYRRLVDHTRGYIEPYRDGVTRFCRRVLVMVMTKAFLARCFFVMAKVGLFFLRVVRIKRLRRFQSLMPPWSLHPMASDVEGVVRAEGEMRGRILLPRGCVQRVVAAQIHDRSVKLLSSQGFEVVVPEGGCCGALPHHMGMGGEKEASKQVRILKDAEKRYGKIDAVISHASGCGSVMKHYGEIVGEEGERYGERVEDISLFLSRVGMRGKPKKSLEGVRVVYHAPCSLQHGQGCGGKAPSVLSWTGASLVSMGESHVCCGSAGLYSLLQGEIADRLRDRKMVHMMASGGSLGVTSNVGCLVQLAGGDFPMCHMSEFLYWSAFGERPYSHSSR